MHGSGLVGSLCCSTSGKKMSRKKRGKNYTSFRAGTYNSIHTFGYYKNCGKELKNVNSSVLVIKKITQLN